MERMSPLEVQEQLSESIAPLFIKTHVRAFATLGCKELSEPLKLHIR